jgi:hypothetical protein
MIFSRYISECEAHINIAALQTCPIFKEQLNNQKNKISNLEEIIYEEEIQGVYIKVLNSLKNEFNTSSKFLNMDHLQLIKNFKFEIDDFIKITLELPFKTDEDVETEFNRLKFNTAFYSKARYARYYLLYLEIKHGKILKSIKHSTKFVDFFKGENEIVSEEYIEEFKKQNKLTHPNTWEQIKYVLENPKDAGIFERDSFNDITEKMNEKFILLYDGSQLPLLFFFSIRYPSIVRDNLIQPNTTNLNKQHTH